MKIVQANCFNFTFQNRFSVITVNKVVQKVQAWESYNSFSTSYWRKGNLLIPSTQARLELQATREIGEVAEFAQ